jgi:hypothetical protein
MYYRRARHAGGTYFFTVNLAERSHGLLTGNIDCMCAAFPIIFPVSRLIYKKLGSDPDYLSE